MKLGWVTQDFPPAMGGIQTYSFELARRLDAQLASCTVFAPSHPGAAAVDAAAPFGVERCLGSCDVLPLTAIPRLAQLATRGLIDTSFHAQWQTLPGALLLRRLGLIQRVFVAAHGRELLLRPFAHQPKLQALYDARRRAWLQAADGVFPVSRFTAQLLSEIGVNSPRTQVVGNGTDPEVFRPMPESRLREQLGVSGRRILLSAGRLTKRKSLDHVIAVLPQIAQQVPDVLFIVVGEGEERGRLETQAQALGIGERVRFLGQVPYAELAEYYNLADVFVTPCREIRPSVEGFGLVFLEANACGKPVIAGRSGGTADALDDGETGFLVTPDDDRELVQRAVQLLKDPELCRRMGEAGRRRVLERGTWDHTSAQLVKALRADAD